MRKKVIYVPILLLFIIAFVSFSVFLLDQNMKNALLLSAMLVWLANILYAITDIKRNVLYFFFNVTFFAFLLGRPLIEALRGEDWFMRPILAYYSSADTLTGMYAIILSQCVLCLGAVCGNYFLRYKCRNLPELFKRNNLTFRNALRVVAIIVFLVSVLCEALSDVEKLRFIQRHSYVEFYSQFVSSLPYVIYIGSTFLEYSAYIFLATLPRKRKAFIILTIMILVNIPELLVGERNPAVLSILFALIYYLLRDFYGDKERWIGRFEKILIYVSAPISIAFLGIYNYVREGAAIFDFNFWYGFTDFFHKQGVTFSWLCSGMGALEYLPNSKRVCYTFGGIIDYFRYGGIGRLISGTTGLGNGNNLLRATKGNSMAHHLSYVLLGNEYLQGHGCGSSYLLEVFADAGYLGVILFSLLLGAILICLPTLCRKGLVSFIILLSSINGFLFMPRAEAISSIQFLFRMPFWCTVIVCFTGALLLYRKNFRNTSGGERK